MKRLFPSRDTHIPRRPLLWLTAALIFTVPPMFGTLATWVPILFLSTLALKFWMEPKGYRLRGVIWSMLLGIVTLVAVCLSYGSIKGIEPGVSIVVVLMSLKILEAHTVREFQVMVLVAWILCLCGFFLSQDLAIALCVLVAFTLLLVALVQFHRGSSPGAFGPPLSIAGKLLSQAAPIIVLLFLFFPRINAGLRFQMGRSLSGATGFSTTLSPGSVASLANSSDVAFRAEFPDGRIPPQRALYWRGVVMWQGQGLEWLAPVAPASIPRSVRRVPAGEGIRQWITIEPHGERWMFALDWPADSPPGTTIAPGDYLWSGQPIRKTKKYEVRSFPETPEKELRPRERKMLLEVPAPISPAVWQLVQSWTASNSDARGVVKSALKFFQTQGFRYSLSPGEYKKNDLEEFLFHRRLGFCEHYAASFATLMRLAGIPSRVVVGYLGGEYNEFGRFFLVRQADTHAWCEVWLPQSGWTRIDPTSVVAPDRINLGLNSFLERRALSGQTESGQNLLVRRLAKSQIFTKVRLAWQTLNYTWDSRVLAFDGEAQESLLMGMGLAEHGPFSVFIGTMMIAAGLIAVYAGWSRFRARCASDRVKSLYERFCRKAARLGATRDPWEGPSDFSKRAARLLPNEARQIRTISDTYISLRYSGETASTFLDQLNRDVESFGSR